MLMMPGFCVLAVPVFSVTVFYLLVSSEWHYLHCLSYPDVLAATLAATLPLLCCHFVASLWLMSCYFLAALQGCLGVQVGR